MAKTKKNNNKTEEPIETQLWKAADIEHEFFIILQVRNMAVTI